MIILRPNSDISYLGQILTFGSGSGRYDRINEVAADDTNGITAGTYGGSSLFGLSDADAIGVIIKVTAKIRVWASGSLGALSRIGLKTGGSTYRGAILVLSPTVVIDSFTRSVNPKTSLAWTWTDINNLQLEISLEASESQGHVRSYPFCSQAWIEVEYETPKKARILIF